jgi:hypothetical protein
MLAGGDCLWRSGTVADSRMLVVYDDRCGDVAMFGTITEYGRAVGCMLSGTLCR